MSIFKDKKNYLNMMLLILIIQAHSKTYEKEVKRYELEGTRSKTSSIFKVNFNKSLISSKCIEISKSSKPQISNFKIKSTKYFFKMRLSYSSPRTTLFKSNQSTYHIKVQIMPKLKSWQNPMHDKVQVIQRLKSYQCQVY